MMTHSIGYGSRLSRIDTIGFRTYSHVLIRPCFTTGGSSVP
jgi:hypothetical protein